MVFPWVLFNYFCLIALWSWNAICKIQFFKWSHIWYLITDSFQVPWHPSCFCSMSRQGDKACRLLANTYAWVPPQKSSLWSPIWTTKQESPIMQVVNLSMSSWCIVVSLVLTSESFWNLGSYVSFSNCIAFT